MYIDLHCHPDMYKEEELPKVVENAEKAGLKVILASGIHPESTKKVLELAEKYRIFKPSLGIYPLDALTRETGVEHKTDVDAELKFIRQNKDKIAAIGEIGLDYKTGEQGRGQRQMFRRLLDLAQELKKPVIIHSRKAEKDVVEILETYSIKKIVMHCFTGKKKLMFRARDNNWYFTVPTNVVRSQEIQRIAREVNLSRLFCETDSPFLSPFPGKKNQPSFVVESYKKIAEIKGMNLDEVGKIIYSNWQRVFC